MEPAGLCATRLVGADEVVEARCKDAGSLNVVVRTLDKKEYRLQVNPTKECFVPCLQPRVVWTTLSAPAAPCQYHMVQVCVGSCAHLMQGNRSAASDCVWCGVRVGWADRQGAAGATGHVDRGP